MKADTLGLRSDDSNHLGFPGGSDGKESACNAGDVGSIPGLGGSPGRGHGNLIQYSCLENPYGWRSLAGYSPRCHKELEQLSDLSIALKSLTLGFTSLWDPIN